MLKCSIEKFYMNSLMEYKKRERIHSSQRIYIWISLPKLGKEKSQYSLREHMFFLFYMKSHLLQCFIKNIVFKNILDFFQFIKKNIFKKKVFGVTMNSEIVSLTHTLDVSRDQWSKINIFIHDSEFRSTSQKNPIFF